MTGTERRSEAIWIESRKLWLLKVQKDGVRKPFQSSTPGRKGKREVEAMADEWLESGAEDMDFRMAWKLFLDDLQKHSGRGNYTNHESAGRLYILPHIKATQISKIYPAQWQKCIDAVISKGLSRRMAINVRSSITAFLAYADRMRWKTVPIKDRDLKVNQAPPPKKKKILQPDAVEKLMTNSAVEKRGKLQEAFYIHSWRFTVLTGMRRGEVYGLQWKDLDDNVICISRSINKFNEQTMGKNDNAQREVVLSDVAMQTLAAQREMLDAMDIRTKWIFPDEWGERSDPNRAYKQWQFFCRTHDIQSSIHEMRHTYISMMKNDLPEQMIKDLVGHSVDMDTFGVYGHVVDREQERAKALMNATFDRLLDGAQPTAPAELPPQVGKVARGHIDTRHTDAAKARAALQFGFVQPAKRGRPKKSSQG